MWKKLKNVLNIKRYNSFRDSLFYPLPFFKSRTKVYKQRQKDMIDIALWPIKKIHAEGSREKNSLVSPRNIQKKFSFLVPEHLYLFKQSNPRHLYQFWMEIIAYRIGKRLGLNMCPTFFAKDSVRKINGSLSEWAYGKRESYVSGGNLINVLIPDYDAEKGKQHNFTHISRLNRVFPNIIDDVIKMLIFDCIIGNTDRHHSNWGIVFVHYRSWLQVLELQREMCNKIYIHIWSFLYKNVEKILDKVLKNYKKYFSPLFDNGTSLGYEILERNFSSINIDAYINRGRHHMKYELTPCNKDVLLGENHIVMIKKLYAKHPKIVNDMLKKVFNLNLSSLRKELLKLTKVKTYEGYELTVERVEFVLRLIEERINVLRRWYKDEQNVR